MIKYYLNDHPIDPPLQIDGLTLKKSRNRRYWGFLYRKLGYVEGLSSLRFEDLDAIALIVSQLERYGVQAETSFRMDQNGETLYDGYLDYITYTADRDGVSIGLRDDRAVVDLERQATTVFSVESTDALSLHARRIGGLATLITDSRLLIIQRNEPYPVSIDHSIPLTRRVEDDQAVAGSPAPVITPLASDPCYYNTTQKDQTVHVTGFVGVTVTTSSANTIQLKVAQLGKEAEAVTIGQWPVSGVATYVEIGVDVSILINVGAAMKLYWTGANQNNRFSFVYDAKTNISLADDPAVDSSVGYGVWVHSLFRSLIFLASGLSFKSTFLENDPDGRLFLATGAGVRGVVKPLPTSIQTLFENLSSLFCLCLWVDGKTVRLERRKNRPSSTSTLQTILSRTEVVAAEFLYNSVKVGYSDWQASDSSLSADEPNGLRSYSTGITVVRNELNLESSLIAASNLIEQQRRRQFDPKTASENKADAMDDKLFLFAATATQAETLQRVDTLTGVYDPSTIYNVRLSPAQSVNRWSEWLTPSLPLRAQSVQGSGTMNSTYDGISVDERNPLAGTLTARIPMLVTVTAPCTLIDYAQLGDFVEYPYNGKWLIGELLDAEWRLAGTGETVTLKLLER